MIVDAPAGMTVRHPDSHDHPRVLAVLDRWWGGFGGDAGSLQRSLLLPRLYFQHFTTTSYVVERGDGSLTAFLVGFLSQTDPKMAYVHFVGVDPACQKQGIATALYNGFFDEVRALGRRHVTCITSPGNVGSQAFHARMGFTVVPGTENEGADVHPDYDGPGLDRVVFSLDLTHRNPTIAAVRAER